MRKKYETNCSICGAIIERERPSKKIKFTCFDCKVDRKNKRQREFAGKKRLEKENEKATIHKNKR